MEYLKSLIACVENHERYDNEGADRSNVWKRFYKPGSSATEVEVRAILEFEDLQAVIEKKFSGPELRCALATIRVETPAYETEERFRYLWSIMRQNLRRAVKGGKKTREAHQAKYFYINDLWETNSVQIRGTAKFGEKYRVMQLEISDPNWSDMSTMPSNLEDLFI